jgi:hypothetical protein
MAKKNQSNARYAENKAAKVGTELICPICGKTFTKKQWAQTFCCTSCKDRFWNRKGDRHREGYYEDYDLQHPERIRNRILYGATQVATIKGLSCAQAREIDEHRMEIAAKLDRYSNKELADMYRNHKYGEKPYLAIETEHLFDDLNHPFDLDGQFDELGY